jgi:hypothetical protein
MYYNLNAKNSSKSGFLDVMGSAKMAGLVNFVIDDWDRSKSNIHLLFFFSFVCPKPHT